LEDKTNKNCSHPKLKEIRYAWEFGKKCEVCGKEFWPVREKDPLKDYGGHYGY
jgi:hypothetical protein